ncbi:MAG: GAF domain-containing protein [Spirochaetia bacterium]|nr:GAF domain-containing protein [Spirochaetota bacterium]MCX8097247.1 GAF domain-containing protein [Spirochaetota bacterium]MDW8111855.1 GAF domain-containing protein [Spirochaetia bacterium]
MRSKSVLKEQMEVYNDLHNLADEIGVDVVSVYYFSKVDKSLVLFASYGLDMDSWGSRINIDKGLVGKCAREMKPLSVKNPMNHPDFYYLPGSGEEKYKTFISFPITEKGELLGVLVIQTIEMRSFRFEEISKMYDIAYKHIPYIYSKAHDL